MKRWMKRSLGSIGVMTLALFIAIAIFWPTIRILMGTEELSGETDAIPKIESTEQKPLIKGDADWISWRGINGDNSSKVTGIIVTADFSGLRRNNE